MNIFSVFTFLGGLAMFLFGIQEMGESLEQAASGTLESMLKRLTSSKLKGMMLGLVVTSIIQSSSATTVTVVGFVNSNIMSLEQAISVIMGANIGTTVTAWLLSTIGIESTNFWVQLCKPSSFSPLMAVVGIIMMMFCKEDKKRGIGKILVSFAVLITGMDLMSSTVKPLSNNPAFVNLLTLFDNPFFGVLIGALITGVIQSSSASVGILQTLSTTGGLTLGMAIPIIMGQNIGTCVTGLLACIGTNKNARRAAIVHLYFNIIGTAIFLILYLVFYRMFSGLLTQTANPASIAIFHSVFNITTTAILMPFTGQLEKLARMTVRDSKEETDNEKTVLLDERLLITPALALTTCKEIMGQMTRLAVDNMTQAVALLGNYDKEAAHKIAEGEDRIDKYEDTLSTFLVKLSAKNLSEEDNRGVSKILHSIGDIERISDHSLNITETAEEIHTKQLQFSDDAKRELKILISAVEEILETATRALLSDDVPLAKWVEPLEEVIDDLGRELKLHHVNRLQGGSSTIEMGFVFADLLNNLERVADHCSNIAICVIELEQNEFNAHDYLNRMERSEFEKMYTECKKRYAL